MTKMKNKIYNYFELKDKIETNKKPWERNK